MSNHLGNLLVTITGKKKAVAVPSSSLMDYFEADVVTAQDYYPFGMLMPRRSYVGAFGYRYGFNGKENDNESGYQDYGMRTYDPLTGRFISVDPITRKYPELTPYQFASNNPIQNIDLDGLEGFVATGINGHGMIISVEDARKAAPKVAEYSKSAAHSFVEDVKSLGKLKTYTDALDFFSLMFVPDISSHIEENDQKRYEVVQGGINEIKNIPNWGQRNGVLQLVIWLFNFCWAKLLSLQVALAELLLELGLQKVLLVDLKEQ